jgi:hypothetical protein
VQDVELCRAACSSTRDQLVPLEMGIPISLSGSFREKVQSSDFTLMLEDAEEEAGHVTRRPAPIVVISKRTLLVQRFISRGKEGIMNPNYALLRFHPIRGKLSY